MPATPTLNPATTAAGAPRQRAQCRYDRRVAGVGPIVVGVFVVLTHALQAVAREPIDRIELEAFLDGVVDTAMEEAGVVGVTLAVTQNDQLVVLKGYGYAKFEAQLGVDPERTLFRIGSVSKLFTYTGLMQLREQGKVDFDTDVNQYLSTLRVPATYDQSVTLRHLFTHSAGFEERIVRLFGDSVEDMVPLSDILNAELPPRVRPPGLVSSYANHGVGLAGLVLEEVSGQSWEDYVQEHILNPLRMVDATPYQPIPAELASQMSEGFRSIDGQATAQPFVFVPMGAAGGISASALAMTRFARAHLGDGSVDGARILSPTSAALMRQPYFEVHPNIRPWLYGFANYSAGDVFVYGHSGGTRYFATQLLLIPDHNISVFVSANSQAGNHVTSAVHRHFLDRYFAPERLSVGPYVSGDVSAYTGSWSSYRNPQTTPDSLLRLTREVRITRAAGDRLRVTGLDRNPTFWVPGDEGEFQREGDKETLIF
ncbi:MAG: serine hydrolase domain-containing protein [Pseudomonadota bacterium]